MKISLIRPCGYCKGVTDALKTVENVVKDNPNTPIFCLGQIVHNTFVNQKLHERGVKILLGDKEQLLDKINEGIVIFSAHGTSQKIIDKARSKNLKIINTICPFVEKGLVLIKKYIDDGYDIIYVGKKKHPEAETAMSISSHVHLIEKEEDIDNLQLKNPKILLTNQTTISILDIQEIYNKVLNKYPTTIISDEICSSTRIRQDAILKTKNNDMDGIIIVGDIKSNNTLNLYNLSSLYKDSVLVDSYNQINKKWLNNKKHIGIISGASTPIELVNDIFEKIKNNY